MGRDLRNDRACGMPCKFCVYILICLLSLCILISNFCFSASYLFFRFMGMRSMSRDESMVEYMLKMLMQVLINFSMGLIMALFVSV